VNFQESLRYLYDLGYELSVKKFGLENTIKLLRALNDPEKNFLKIQIAGTNGKGSVCAFLDSICVSAGIKTACYTSPHLVSITERIKIDGAEISEKDFARHAGAVREVSEKLVESGELNALPTFFEQVTAIALNYFAEQKVELAILETGLGGRFDSTTATNAEIVALTPIDLDHQDILGNSLTEIASEKAAIIREGATVVVSEQKEEAMKIISERCAKFGVKPILAHLVSASVKGINASVNERANRPRDTRSFTVAFPPLVPVDFQTEKAEYENVRLGLSGRHQIENAKVAILLAEILQENFKITAENIIEGLQTARHKGRLEFRENFLFDGAHNVGGAKALKDFLDEFITQPITMIFGVMREKDFAKIATILFPKAEKLIFTTPDSPRSIDAKDLLEFLPGNFPREKVFISENTGEALEIAQKISSGEDLILVTGSLYLIGEAQKILDF
jgi:dihydrofolate synthase/folylpolyglutamate synthase